MNISTAQIFEWSGCLTGLLGAFLVATNSELSSWGFVAFLVSNLCWTGFGILKKANGLLLMQVGFTFTSILGIKQWFF